MVSVPPVSRLLDLSGRVAIVTGASGGIGGGIARRLAEAGAYVVCHYHDNRGAAESVVETIRSEGGRATALHGDVSTSKGVAEITIRTQKIATEEVDKPAAEILVNNAARQPVQMLADIAEGDWNAMFSTNVTGPFLLIQAFAERLRQVGAPGAVINIASIEAHHPASGHGHYAASKAALAMLTRAAALEYGSAGIRVNAVSPGLVHRDGLEKAWPEGVGRWQAAAPLGRLGRPDDIADAVLFLASDAARWITGVELTVDGGVSVRPTW